MDRFVLTLLLLVSSTPALAQNRSVSDSSVVAAGTGGQSHTLRLWLQGIEKSGGVTNFVGEAGPGVLQFSIGNTALATEYWLVKGGITGNGASLSTQGSASNVDGVFAAKGTGGFWFGNGSGTNLRVIDPGTTADRWVTITGATSTGTPTISTSAGGLTINQPDTQVSYWKQNGYTQAAFGTTSAVGSATTAWVRLHSVAGSNYARISADGTDGSGNTPFYINARGTGNFTFANGTGNLATFALSSANTVINYLALRTSSATQPVLVQPNAGNIAIGGAPGTMAALATTATTGYVGIPTMAGAPTGVPETGASGAAYLVYDTTNEKLCRYWSGAWKCSAAFTP